MRWTTSRQIWIRGIVMKTTNEINFTQFLNNRLAKFEKELSKSIKDGQQKGIKAATERLSYNKK